jgi:hypothetical protein
MHFFFTKKFINEIYLENKFKFCYKIYFKFNKIYNTIQTFMNFNLINNYIFHIILIHTIKK